MKLVIPMAGEGGRFLVAGYQTPKPLIEVEGKPVIAHVLDMFPDIDEVVFICNDAHLANSSMQVVLHDLRPDAAVIGIDPKRLGPVYAVSLAFDFISNDEDVMVSYCDFTQVWDFEGFKQQTGEIAGAVPAYTGFHPHLLKRNLYAGIIRDENGRMDKIMEKHCFTPNPEESHHSSGAYYFRSGELLKRYTRELLDSGNTINGEYYVSMLFPLMLRDGHLITVPEMSHFMQWGTPEDLEEYEAWSRRIHTDLQKKKGRTHIPAEREPHVQIPYGESTAEFKKSYAYWSEHFRSI